MRIAQSFLDENPDAYIQLGNRLQAIQPGWHFGSRFPGDPARIVVYDFLPDTLLDKVENRAEFRGVLAFDKWMANADSRQAIFFRAQLKEWQPAATTPRTRLGFVAQMMDNGFVLDGPHWRLADSPLQGLYFRPLVYSGVRALDDFQPWLDRIVHFPEEVIDQAVKQIPPAWLEDDERALTEMLDRLLARRKRVPDLIEDCRSGKMNPFPNWR